MRSLLLAVLLAAAPAWAADEEEKVETFGGVGMSLAVKDGPMVLAVVPGSPAERAGIQPGDRILKIDGSAVAGLGLEQIVQRVRGPVGSAVTITVSRGGSAQARDYALVRQGITMDPATQLKLARQGADKGFADSQASLGALTYAGRGVDKDLGEARQWFEKAARQGSPLAFFYIGLMHYRGELSEADHTEAYYWWRQAAERGLAGAQQNLGSLYHAGDGIARNDVQAYRWLRLASRQGLEGAAKKLEEVEAGLTPEQLERAKGLAGEGAPREAGAAEAEPGAPLRPTAPAKAVLTPADAKLLDDQLLP